jgi:hypothetical protein
VTVRGPNLISFVLRVASGYAVSSVICGRVAGFELYCGDQPGEILATGWRRSAYGCRNVLETIALLIPIKLVAELAVLTL